MFRFYKTLTLYIFFMFLINEIKLILKLSIINDFTYVNKMFYALSIYKLYTHIILVAKGLSKQINLRVMD